MDLSCHNAGYYRDIREPMSDYDPILHISINADGDEAPPHKKAKQCHSTPSTATTAATTTTTTNVRPYKTSRILGRKYALTSTFYKYLEIGINVGEESCVEIVLGDNRGNEIILPHKIWEKLISEEQNISRHLRQTPKTPLLIHELVITTDIFKNEKVLKLTLFDKTMFFRYNTFHMIYDFEDCINNMYTWLSRQTEKVNERVKEFAGYLTYGENMMVYLETKVTNFDWPYAATIIRESNDYDRTSLIDSELITHALQAIVYAAYGADYPRGGKPH